MRKGVSTSVYVATVAILLVAALAEAFYFNSSLGQESNTLSTVVSQLISPTTITQYQGTTTVTSFHTMVTSGAGATSVQTVTVTASNSGKSGLYFNTTLIIIPRGVAANKSENFVPATVKVIIGVNNTITWINQDPLSQHTVVTTSTPNGSPPVDLILGTNQTYAITFKVPGTYLYYCMWHPGWMKGTIVVTGP